MKSAPKAKRGATMAIRIDFADRDVLMEMDPGAFWALDAAHPRRALGSRPRMEIVA